MKLKSKGASLRIDFTMTLASFSFEGYISDFDGSTLVVEAPRFGKENPPTFSLSALQISSFDGDFREDEFGMYLTLMITRPVLSDPREIFRFYLTGDWNPKGRHVM